MRISGIALLLLLLSSCAFFKPKAPMGPSPSETETNKVRAGIKARPELPGRKVPVSEESETKALPQEEVLVNTERLSPSGASKPKPPKILALPSVEIKDSHQRDQKKKEISLDLEGADLLDFLDLVLKETLGLNYIVDPGARARITAHIYGQFLPAELIEIVRAILALHHLELVKQNEIWKIIPVQKIGQAGPYHSFLVVRPRYIPVKNLTVIVKQFVSPQAKVLIESQSNILLVIARPENLKTVLNVVKILDRESFIDFVFRIYSPQVLPADILVRYLQQTLNSSTLKASGLGRRIALVALKELDNVLIVARHEEDLEKVWNLIKAVDRGELKEEEIFIYQVENGDAEEIARLLEDVFSEIRSSRRKTVIKAKKTKAKPSRGAADLEGAIKIVPDKTNNLLLIRATKEDYRKILNILKKIDVVPRQVVIEVLIAEITLNKALEYGLEWYLKTAFNLEGKSLKGDVVFSREGRAPTTLPSEISGFTYALFRGNSLRSLLYALSSVSKVNILSNPVLLATDNKMARIQIGQEVPIITQKVTNTSASTPTITSNVQYRDSGIILEVKPHINSGGLVKLDIVQEVSTAQQNYLGLDSPLFTKRRIETSLVVEDGQTVILGGLIDTRNEVGKTGVPLLRRLPVLGKVFEWTASSKNRTELFIAITPRVVRSRGEAERVMRDFKRRIEDLRKRLEKEM